MALIVPIIYQFRPKIKIKDNINTIGCEIILKSITIKVILNLKNSNLKTMESKNAKIYKRSDLDVNSLKKAKKYE